MSEIRVTYSGLISLIIGIGTVGIGAISTIIITRSLSPEEFGTWGMIYGLINYVIFSETLISYWTTREIAREEKSGKTAIISSGSFSILGIFAYIFVVFILSPSINTDYTILFYGFVLIPVIFLHKTLISINLGWKPQNVSYGLLTFSLSQVPMAYLFIHYLDMGVTGVITTVFISYAIANVSLFILGIKKIKERFQIRYIKKWIKFSWISLISIIVSIVATLDIIIFPLVVGSVEGLSFWYATIAVTVIISQSSAISKAAYAKILHGKDNEFLGDNLTYLFYFAILFTVITISFAQPALFILNPVYVVGVAIIILISLQLFFNSFGGVFHHAITGTEKVDMFENNPKFKNFVKSELFKVPIIILIQYLLRTSILIVVLVAMLDTSSQVELVIYWALITLLTEIPFTVFFYTIVKKRINIKLDHKAIGTYFIVGAIIFCVLHFSIDEYINYEQEFIGFFIHIFLIVCLTIISYVGITYVIDSRTRNLIKSILKEIKK